MKDEAACLLSYGCGECISKDIGFVQAAYRRVDMQLEE
jgi:hypothetical protein